MAAEDPGDRHAYLEEQLARQKRGEPIDVDWVRAELGRVRDEQQKKLAAAQRHLRWLVIGSGISFCALWVGGNIVNHRDPGLIVPIVVIAALAIWALTRRRR
jgi:Flp pilus assembly protein TadB